MSIITVAGESLITSVTDPETLQRLTDSLVDRHVAHAREAYESGNREGLIRALEILGSHRRGAAWPDWITNAILADFAQQRQPPQPRRGRHAQDATRRRDDAVDCVRATFMECYALNHLNVTEREVEQFKLSQENRNKAAGAVTGFLGGDAGGTAPVLEVAYDRFHERVRSEPARYYPLLDWRGWMLLEASQAAPPRILVSK